MNERAPFGLLLAVAALAASFDRSSVLAAPVGLTLRQAVDDALGRSPDLVAARSALEEGVAGVREIGSPLRPNLFATTTPGYSTGLPVGVAGELPSLVGVRLRMVLLDLNLKADRFGSEGRAAYEERWFKPLVQLDARYSYVPPGFNYAKYFLNFSSNVAAAGLSVVVPVLTGGRETARAFRARARASRLEAEGKAREEELAVEARRADAALGPAALDVSVARRARALGEEAVREARVLEAEGRGDPDGVPRAEIELAGAEDEVSRAEEALVVARLRLLALRGELGSWGNDGAAPR